MSAHTDGTQCPHPTHNTHTPNTTIEHPNDYSGPRFALVRGTDQEVTHTASRRSGPRRWLRAVRWLIAAGLHSRANATTQRIAEDLAQRMNYDTGHVLYGLDEMVARLGISRASIARHIGYLRELGALAWAQHGTRTNRYRALGLKGYAGTATIYAAVMPAVYDHAMGHTIVGSGYEARIIIDQRGQQPTIPAPRSEPVDNPPVDNSAPKARETPSLTVVKKSGQVQVEGGVTTTAQRQRTDSTPNTSSRKRRATILGNTVTARGMQHGAKLAAAIRRRVSWVHRASHDQLRWVCADMGEQQWTEDQAVRFVVEAGFKHRAGFAWEPSNPHRLIAAELRAHQEQQQADRQMQENLAQAVAWEDSTAAKNLRSLAALFGTAPAAEPEPVRTDEDRLRARMDWNIWPKILDHLAEDELDALDLYGKSLVDFAIEQGARLDRQGAWA
ncbi:hypothetical protein HUT11_35340 (plasmid) [Streptomyces seoulensis]|nr:hypothetical protein HUT11_35340 [Streptomyces seoulensis]